MNWTKILAVLGGLAGAVAMALTPEQLVELLGARGPGALVLAGSLLTFAREQYRNRPDPSAIKSHWLVGILAVALAIVALPGCATFGGKPIHLESEGALAAQLTTQYAVQKFIDRSENPAGRAAKVKQVAQSVIDHANGDASATVAELSEIAYAEIAKRNLDSSDVQLARSLVMLVATELNQHTADGLLKQEDVVLINQVFGWITQATEPYLP